MIDYKIETTVSEVDRIFALQKTQLQAVKNQTAGMRLTKIRAIENYLLDPQHEIALCKALWADLRKSREEVLLTEISPLLTAIKHIRTNLSFWMDPKKVGSGISLLGVRSHIHYEPKGQILIIVPWNYPLMLSLMPLIHAIAAGNTIILKPSEISGQTAVFINEMISSLFEESEIAVIEGDAETSQALLKKPFDHIFFTGSPAIGKIVMRAAAENLSSVTLELGGKSPVIVDETVNLQKSAAKLVWGKCMNAGQTCIAPDYALVHESVFDKYLVAIDEALNKQYNPNNAGIQESPFFGRIVSKKHFLRIRGLVDDAVMKGAKLVVGGEMDESDSFISPVILTEVTDDMEIMSAEIFGPVLPILPYRDLAEALDTINRRPKPLALYIQSNKKATVKRIINETSAGGTVINDFNLATVNPDLPFGGVNNSGIGKSNGFHSFLDFSNERGIMRRKFGTFSPLYAPFKTFLFEWVKRIARW